MENKELKQKLWDELSKKYSHLNEFCTIKLNGINDNEIYFHPIFIISDDFFITSQCDTKNKFMYALRIVWLSKNINIEIDESIFEALIIGFYTNKESVLIAIETMGKIQKQIYNLQNYTTEYIKNILIGNSINEITECFINELKANQKLISFLQSKK